MTLPAVCIAGIIALVAVTAMFVVDKMTRERGL
jgi:hypothetical protein